MSAADRSGDAFGLSRWLYLAAAVVGLATQHWTAGAILFGGLVLQEVTRRTLRRVTFLRTAPVVPATATAAVVTAVAVRGPAAEPTIP